MFFIKISDCCGPRGTYHIPVLLFIFPFIISSPFLWMYITCLSSVMVHPSSHETPNDIIGAVCIFVKLRIYLASLIRPGSWSVAICVDSIFLPSGSLAFISIPIITGAIVWGGLSC